MWLRRLSGLAGNQKVASLLSVEVSLSKTLHPNCSQIAGFRLAWLTPTSVCECVYEWVNVKRYCKALLVATG